MTHPARPLPRGAGHQLFNDGADPLVLLFCCSPPYSHEDTVVV
jgi:mannose-6-phosphate isomerase-like protein (cupin superfamily)